MLTRLLPDQVAKFWDIIKYAIEESLPPITGEHPDKMNNILTSLLVDKTQCWASYERGKDSTRFEAIMLTRILYDDASRNKNLLIYCAYGYDMTSRKSLLDGTKAILKYAKSRGCSQVVAYTNIDSIVTLAKRFGAEAVYHFITIDVDEIVKKFNELE